MDKIDNFLDTCQQNERCLQPNSETRAESHDMNLPRDESNSSFQMPPSSIPEPQTHYIRRRTSSSDANIHNMSSSETYHEDTAANNNTAAPQHHHSFYTHSSTSNLLEDNTAMREFDAEILELGVEVKRQEELADFDEHGQRLEASASVASLSDLDLEAATYAAVVASGVGEKGSSTNVDYSGISLEVVGPPCTSSEVVSPLRSPSRKSMATSSNSMPVIKEDSSSPLSPEEKSAPSLPVGLPDQDEDECIGDNIDTNDFFIGGDDVPQSPRREGDTINNTISTVEEVSKDSIAKRRAHKRSDSFDRRKSESAQFAEAVGESNLLLNKIIEEDSSSDFDDDDIDEDDGGIGTDEMEGGEEVMEDIGAARSTTQTPVQQDKSEPTCVSMDLSRLSVQEDEQCAQQPSSEHSREMPQSSVNMSFSEDSMLNVSKPMPSSATSTPAASPLSKLGSNGRFPHLAIHPPFIDWKFTRQYSSGANLLSGNAVQSAGGTTTEDGDLAYRGIRSTLLEITQRGVARGNYAQLHRKAWLEVSDKHHRYGKNLRLYYKEWESLGHPFHMFFDWLDSKGEAHDNPLPDMPECPRSVLDSDTVLYITDPKVSASYALDILADPADGSAVVLDHDTQLPVSTGKEGWIFVLRDHVLYGSQKVTAPSSSAAGSPDNNCTSKPRQRFHHSTFFGGKAVASAGIFLTNEQGRLTDLWPHSGHYRPGEAHMQRALFFLQQQGVDLSTFDVDMQQIFKVSRKKAPKDKIKHEENESATENVQMEQNGFEKTQLSKKAKKTDCLHLMGGSEVACFLAHKARMIEKGVFYQIHKIRMIPHEFRGKTRSILNLVN